MRAFIHPLRSSRPIQDIVYQNGKPLFALLRLLGVLPITRTAPGVTVFKMGSASMAYSLFMFVLVVVSKFVLPGIVSYDDDSKSRWLCLRLLEIWAGKVD